MQNRLDDLNLSPPFLIKVDAEGAEEKIFQGGANVLSKHTPLIIFESSRNFKDPQSTINPLEALKKLGYTFFQPVIVMKSGDSSYPVGYGHYNNKLPNEIELALVEFSLEQRFLLDGQINILGCHNSKLDYLKQIFC